MSVAVVTGGGSGLGAAVARHLRDDGFEIVVADIDGDAAAEVAESIRGTAVTADVTKSADVRALFDRTAGIGAVTAVVLSAAVEVRAPLEDTSDDDWRRVIDVNLKGPFLCLQAAVPHLRAAGGGSVVALGSTLGLTVAPQYAAYCASKGALVNLCKQVAIEHAPDAIRVNVLAPSATDTGLFVRLTDLAPDPEAVRAGVAANMPMQRLGTAAEVCDAVSFLVGPGSTYLSGAVIPLDGGLAARRM